ncbi:nucleotide-sensitive chloride conductance regulator (ICln) family protein [Arabidopsis thaliana]|uniref:Isoform 2 of Chloride conductance regulatory protein ICln n=1 Tax=Arabidopsis thaliana TaxID=3702 RepID=Q9LVA7-2|nr:nucleotide-sensitive chloride conductance regulator (ICln) family protein [Arabidopsis thaliana]AED97592.1 nucleotide-sensitive chloride conductance regulator (ICln) family protein [Arabidopsis thaliana]|eukprot:NP_001119478.1 nucleotide-sensitive chloride conductance regulator (ICln) family protein [Arabidopsis thaliana]
MVAGLRDFTLRTEDGSGKPVLDESNGEELMHVQTSVAVALGNRPIESPGTLYITSRKLIWLSDVDMAKGYAVDFLSISLHAVSRDPEAYSSPCIYTQIEVEEDEDDESDSESTEVLDLSKIREMRLVPSDSTQLETLFDVFCECAELNPEPVQEEEESGHNWVFSADQMDVRGGDDDAEWQISQSPTSVIGHSNGDEGLNQPMLELQINDQRFEDAEEMVHESETKDH